MADYASRLDDGDETKLRVLGNTAASGDGSSNGTFYRAILLVRRGKVYLFLSDGHHISFMFIVLFTFFYIYCLQYDEAREFVERARKCLATELAALVSFFIAPLVLYYMCNILRLTAFCIMMAPWCFHNFLFRTKK